MRGATAASSRAGIDEGYGGGILQPASFAQAVAIESGVVGLQLAALVQLSDLLTGGTGASLTA